jgi:hypothetical protein
LKVSIALFIAFIVYILYRHQPHPSTPILKKQYLGQKTICTFFKKKVLYNSEKSDKIFKELRVGRNQGGKPKGQNKITETVQTQLSTLNKF